MNIKSVQQGIVPVWKRRRLKYRSLCPALFFICVLTPLLSCTSRVAPLEPVARLEKIETILVLPFKDMTDIYGDDVTIRCPVCGKIFFSGRVEEGAENILTEHLVSFLNKHTSFQVIPPEQAQGSISIRLQKNEKILQRKMLAEIGRTLDADAVMAGSIYRYRERVGKKYSVITPASAAFDIHLIDASSGGILWSGDLDETQVSLSENFLEINRFIQRKGRWITAEELASTGLKEMLQILVKLPEASPEGAGHKTMEVIESE